MRPPRFLAASALVALSMLLSPLIPSAWGSARSPQGVGAQSNCVLIVNGDFELPELPDSVVELLSPTIWSGTVHMHTFLIIGTL